MPNVTKIALDNFAAANNKKFRGRHKYIGGSEVGQCARKIWYLKNRYTPTVDPEGNWGARTRGHSVEDLFWIPAMRAHYGRNLLFTGDRQKRCKVNNISGASDGLLINQPRDALAGLFVPDIGPSGCIVLDCKSIDPRINLNDAKPEHTLQMQTNIGLIRETTGYKPDWGLIIYINASFYDDVVEFPVKYDSSVYGSMHIRANKIMNATSAAEMLPEGWIAGGKECEYCPFLKACKSVRQKVPTNERAPDPQFVAEMHDLARTERRYAKAVDDATARQRALQNEIKERLKSKDTKRLTCQDSRSYGLQSRAALHLTCPHSNQLQNKSASIFKNSRPLENRLTVLS